MASLPPSRNAQNLAGLGLKQSGTRDQTINSHSSSEKVSSPGSNKAKNSTNDPQFQPVNFSRDKPGITASADILSSSTTRKVVYSATEIDQSTGNGESRQKYTLQTLSDFTGTIIERLQYESLPPSGAHQGSELKKIPSSVSKGEETRRRDEGMAEIEKPLRPGSRLNLKA